MAQDIEKILIKVVWLAGLAALCVLGLYMYKFGPGQWFELSGATANWGVFGDFVGGLLNPFFSFLAFIGVVLTVVLQAKQLDIAKAQSNFEEIQRVMSSISSQVDVLLAEKPIGTTGQTRAGAAVLMSMFGLISAIGSLRLERLAKGDGGLPDALSLEAHMQFLQEDNIAQLTVICLQLETLAWNLNRYIEAGGSRMVIESYQYRYRAITVWLDVMELLTVSGQTHIIFKPKEYRHYMTEKPPTS